MSERSSENDRATPIAKGYVDDVGGMLFAAIIIVLVISTLTDSCQNSKTRDLQRRVAELESLKK